MSSIEPRSASGIACGENSGKQRKNSGRFAVFQISALRQPRISAGDGRPLADNSGKNSEKQREARRQFELDLHYLQLRSLIGQKLTYREIASDYRYQSARRARVSEDKISLEFLAARVAALTDRMHDLELRFAALETRFGVLEARLGAFVTAIETRFDGLERRYAMQEERMSRMLAILVRMAERQGLPPEGRSQ